MEPLYTGALIVDHKFHPSTQRFAVETPYDARIEVLKQKAQEKRPELSSFILSDLGVWRMKGDMVIKKLKLSELLGKIDINDENTIEALDDEERVANMGLSFGETLLLQTHAARDVITRDVAPEYKHRVLKAIFSTSDSTAGQLEDCGYKVVSDVSDPGDGGTCELINKPPAHIRTVCRQSDLNDTKYIAKRLRERSKELAIHEYLQSRPSKSPHIISFIEVVPSTTREWLILPKLYPIRHQWFMNEGGAAGRIRLGWGLIRGLAYLHEHKIAHRDINPNNLVRDHIFNFKILDFDLAIKVEDENIETFGFLGTEGRTAPEVGKQGGLLTLYSPIKADRWSCGRVILRHIMIRSTVINADRRLLNFANQLLMEDPQQQPSLPQVGSHVGVSRPQQHLLNVNGESMELPDAKRLRLE